MGVKLRKRKRTGNTYSLFLDIYHQGKRRFEYLNLFLTDDKANNKAVMQLAENVRAKRQLELQNEMYGFISETRMKDDFVAYFNKMVQERPEDRSSWKCTLKKIKEYSGGSVAFMHITPEWLNGFKKHLLNSVSQITAYHYYSNLKYAFNRAVREKIIYNNPCSLVESIKKPETKREYLLLDEIKLLSETPCVNQNVKDAFLFSCFTGLRFSDVRKLTWADVKVDKIEFMQKKTKSIEYLPLSQTAIQILDRRYKENKDSVLVFNIPTKPVTWDNIKRWVDKAGIRKRVSFHTARHTFATLSLTSGIDLYTVSKLLGHKDIATTQVYAKIIDQKKIDAVNKLPIL